MATGKVRVESVESQLYSIALFECVCRDMSGRTNAVLAYVAFSLMSHVTYGTEKETQKRQ